METVIIAIIIIAVLLFLSGLLIGLLYERKQAAALFNGNVLVTSQVERLVQKCAAPGNPALENQRIKAGIRLLSEGFSVNETIQIISKENEPVLPNN